MTNSVTVTAAFGSSAQGNYLFAATGTLMSDANVAIVTPVLSGVLDSSGNMSVSLLASDNFSPGELTWNCFITVRGLSDVNVQGFAVNFSLGASQNLFTILKASGWNPLST
jgi:hypothetical protein